MFEIIHKIGKGSSGYVYKALNKKDKKTYAIKQSLSQENDDLIKNEIEIYKKFKNECPNIVYFYDYFQANNESGKTCLCIQIEYCQYGSIREIIKKGKINNIFINEIEISSIIYMVLKSLVFIHKNNLIDRDIKGRNILVDKEGTIKLCDFGICKAFHKNNMKHLRGGSPYWMAPEVLKKEEYDQTIDIWALGITCIELAEHEPPYFNLSPKEVMKQIIKSPPKGLNNKSKWSKEFNNFISCCLNIDRNKRPSAEELLKHNFITNIDNKNINRKLIILQFISKCGYKVIYNRKIKITPLINANIINIKKIVNNSILNDKKGLLSLRKKNERILSSQFNSNSKKITNKLYFNKRLESEGKHYKKQRSISFKSSGVFIKKLSLRCKSLDKNIDKNYKIISSNNIDVKKKIIYKRNIKSLNKTISNRYKNNLTLENNSLNNANSVSNLNKKVINNRERKNILMKTFLKESKIKDIMGKEILDNFDEKKEFLIEDGDNEKNMKNKIFEDEIKELLKQRDIEIKNIMLKYQDKVEKMKKEQNQKICEK